MKAAPLMTRWAADVDPANVLPEYPRPQMAREDWLNLNGVWQFAIVGYAPPIHYQYNILVPFPMESAISGIMSHSERVWYRRTFTVPAAWAGNSVILHFGAVDWESEVFINGASVGIHRGGYDRFEFDITRYLRDEGENELVVRVYDPTDAGFQPMGKQSLWPSGTFYTAVTGIWQTVWLEPVNGTRITDVKLVPDIDNECLNVTAFVSGVGASTATVNATARDGGTVVGVGAGGANATFSVPVPAPQLWSPSSPFLYDLNISVANLAGDTIDAITSYFGMRKVSLGVRDGYHKILLNDNFTFQIGPLDQGYWPDGVYTAPTDEALRWDVEAMKSLGFNMARKHMKVEPDRWYYWCDKLGLLVWQDMPFGQNTGEEGHAAFELELRRMIECRGNHPSIATWVVFNEGWGQYDTIRLTGWVKELDPSRIVSCASGWVDFEVGDVKDLHQYSPPTCPVSTSRAVVNGEFGGIGMHIEGHTWTDESWAYIRADNQTHYHERYGQLLSQIEYLAEHAGMSAAVYTQITDIEQEQNGLVTYDRAVFKGDPANISAANQFSVEPVLYRAIMSTSQLEGQLWNYTTSSPGAGWQNLSFDGSGWSSGPGGFGTWFTLGSVVRTTWDSPDIWLRKAFNPGPLNATEIENLVFRVQHDDGVEVYINGILAFSATGYITMYKNFDFNAGGKAAIVPDGHNVVAVHCHQDWGGQSIDIGINVRI
ncbi:MAG: glycoside hydrolase family 2 [Candidatus Lokiarchaeota archaeon]|nr:glycoside hydrolase family 2 [Candidatus Lokiarchaeota archaeon]